jgi:hypothetical protein
MFIVYQSSTEAAYLRYLRHKQMEWLQAIYIIYNMTLERRTELIHIWNYTSWYFVTSIMPRMNMRACSGETTSWTIKPTASNQCTGLGYIEICPKLTWYRILIPRWISCGADQASVEQHSSNDLHWSEQCTSNLELEWARWLARPMLPWQQQIYNNEQQHKPAITANLNRNRLKSTPELTMRQATNGSAVLSEHYVKRNAEQLVIFLKHFGLQYLYDEW